MPVRVSNLVRDRRTIQVPVGDEALTITYRPGGITPATEGRLREYSDDQRGGAALVALLADCLVEWDLLDDEGQPLPLDTKTLSQLPVIFLGHLAQAITEDMRPNLPSAGNSGAGSLPRGD